MTILIVENEAFIVEDIKDMLGSLGYSKVYDTDTVNSATDMIKSHQPDIVLIDIDLNGDKDGIELGETLHQEGIPFIYLSDLQDISTFNRAKSTQPQTNLAKPVNQLQLRNALLEVDFDSTLIQDVSCIWVTYKDKKTKINKADILYLKAAGNNCDIFLEENEGYEKDKYVSSIPMGRVLETINYSNFIQVHKSYCINSDKVEKYWGNRVILKGVKDEIPMSDTFKSNFTSNIKSI